MKLICSTTKHALGDNEDNDFDADADAEDEMQHDMFWISVTFETQMLTQKPKNIKLHNDFFAFSL